jgi:nucleoside triphosphate pyrophosphatase
MIPQSSVNSRKKTPALILASASSGRRELLEEAGLAFSVQVAGQGVEDLALKQAASLGFKAGGLALAAALAKGRDVAGRASEENVILAADTIVLADDGTVLGKGANDDESKAILRKLAGTRHQVISGAVLIAAGVQHEIIASTTIQLKPMSEEEIDSYVASGRSRGASGGYRIQRDGTDAYLSIVEGSLSNVVGLPMEKIMPLLADSGIKPEIQ